MTEEEQQWSAERFEENRPRLRAAAYRMLGSASEAEDAVQEAWLRLSRSGPNRLDNLEGWLTTVLARVCMDMLRSRRARRQEPLGDQAPERAAPGAHGTDPEQEALLADSVGLALLAVLETLSPAERVAFVLHDIFDLPFDEIAQIVDRSPAAARQLASRARRRVRGARPPEGDIARRREVVDAFLAASRDADFERLLALLDPGVVLRADPAAVQLGAPNLLRGATEVGRTFSGRARVAKPALVNGTAGAVWAPGGRPRVVFTFTITGGMITGIGMLADPARIRRLDLVILPRREPPPGRPRPGARPLLADAATRMIR